MPVSSIPYPSGGVDCIRLPGHETIWPYKKVPSTQPRGPTLQLTFYLTHYALKHDDCVDE